MVSSILVYEWVWVGAWVHACLCIHMYVCACVFVCVFFFFKLQCIDQALDRFMYALISVDALVHG